MTTVEVKIKVTTLGGFVPGIDGAVCFNVDGDSVCRYTEPLQSSGGPVVWNKTTGLSAVANSGKAWYSMRHRLQLFERCLEHV